MVPNAARALDVSLPINVFSLGVLYWHEPVLWIELIFHPVVPLMYKQKCSSELASSRTRSVCQILTESVREDGSELIVYILLWIFSVKVCPSVTAG